MKHTRLRHVVAGVALATLLLGIPSAFAGSSLPTGTVAPEFEGKEFINTGEVSIKSLRGRVIFYDIFRTT